MQNFLKNKSVLIAISVSLFILILIIAISPKKSSKTAIPTPTPNYDTERTELVDLSKEKRNQASIYVDSIEKKLPISLEEFPTSVGISTSINLYRLKDDPSEVVRMEIYGLSYLNEDPNPQKNPNVTAFKESYKKAIEMLESKNIDPKKLIFIYGDKEYVRKTSEIWISKLNLHP